MSEEAKVRHTDEAIAIVSSGRKTDLIGRNGSVKIPKIDHNDSDMLSGTLLMSPISTNSLTQAPSARMPATFSFRIRIRIRRIRQRIRMF